MKEEDKMQGKRIRELIERRRIKGEEKGLKIRLKWNKEERKKRLEKQERGCKENKMEEEIKRDETRVIFCSVCESKCAVTGPIVAYCTETLDEKSMNQHQHVNMDCKTAD
ncbi:Hypothetical predicted protein [Scomber scombrus]|uniref:Uncharacterized protein n=1 Tax=Scomber scombrus TaxID=13677 RepID=A0AAV1PML4_SCOSC